MQAVRLSNTHTLVECYVHLIWTFKHREPLLSLEHLTFLKSRLFELNKQQPFALLAMGGFKDHVHCCVRLPGALSISEVAKSLKGNSIKELRDYTNGDINARWQRGYGAFSISKTALPKVMEYVTYNWQRHKAKTMQDYWEL